MFERYTEKARRVIFFARYEASIFGSPHIETEHLLLGLLREDMALVNRFLGSQASRESIREEIEGHTPRREKISTSVDLPISEECKRVLAYAAEEAKRLSHKHIGTEHLLLGLLRVEKCFAAQILRERGLELSKVRGEIAKAPQERGETEPPRRSKETSRLFELGRDLTEAAANGELDPLVGRNEELARLICVLCRRARNNPLLIGEPGVGKTAIVHGLAQRIASEIVPPRLRVKRLLAFDFSGVLALAGETLWLEHRVMAFLKEAAEQANLVIFLEDLFTKAGAPGSMRTIDLLKPFLTQGGIQLIAAATPSDYKQAFEEDNWLKDCFNAIEVRPPDEAEAVKLLAGIKERFEKFHGVVYTEDALRYAVAHSQRYLPGRFLPDKAVDLLDEAGACVKMRAPAMPEEVTDVEKRLKFLAQRIQHYTAAQDTDKVQFYSAEERKEREVLQQLRAKYNLEAASNAVTVDDIEYIVAQWTGVPLDKIKQERGSPGPADKS